jgi:hypothetical protein
MGGTALKVMLSPIFGDHMTRHVMSVWPIRYLGFYKLVLFSVEIRESVFLTRKLTDGGPPLHPGEYYSFSLKANLI